MKLEKINPWLTLLANVGVVAGIVFLAVEVRQNQSTLERGNAMNLVAVQDAAQDRFAAFRRLILENEDLYLVWRKALDDASLTDMEQSKFNNLCDDYIFGMSTTHRLYTALGRAMEAQNAVQSVRDLIARSGTLKDCWMNRVRPAAERSGYFEFIGGIDAP